MPQTSKQLTADDYARAATALGVPVAAVKAVTEVESNGKGFLPDGRPLILYERHIMRRQLVAAGHAMDAVRYNLTDPNIVNSKPGGYVGGAGEWDRLARAIEINRRHWSLRVGACFKSSVCIGRRSGMTRSRLSSMQCIGVRAISLTALSGS